MSKIEIPHEIPSAWLWSTVEELGIVLSGGTPATNNPDFWGEDIAWVTPADLSNFNGKYISAGKRSISKLGLDYSSATLLPEGTLLYSSRAPIGYIVIARNSLATNQGFKNLVPTKYTYIDYIYYYLQSAKQIITKMANGTTFLELSSASFSKIPVPLAPLNEQKRIVIKIEEIFSELDNAKENLQKTLHKLKIYRQVVLKNAFEGKFTENWRFQNDPEPAEKIIEKMSTEKQNKNILPFSNKEKINENNNKKNLSNSLQNQSLQLQSNDNLEISSIIPKSWKYTYLQNITQVITDGDHQAPPKSMDGVPFITISNIKNNRIDFRETFFVNNDYFNSLAQYKKPAKGDILYTVTGSFGIPVVVDFEKDFCFQRHISLIRPDKRVDSKWLYFLLQTPFIYNQAASKATGTAQKTVGLASIRSFIVPLCSLEEQQLIVQETEKQFSLIDHLEAIINSNNIQVEHLRQSVLKMAFEGKLVEQDTEDEPAIKLLSRITEEKTKYLHEKKIADKLKPKIKKMENKEMTILEVLAASNNPLPAKLVWERSKHKDSIEDFYAELKKIQHKVKEVEKGILTLVYEN